MRHADTAIALAKSADAGGYHFGAVIFRRRDVVSVGWCQNKSHPEQAKYMARSDRAYKRSCNWLHAEVHAIVSAKSSVENCDIIVARWADNMLKDSCPCPACKLALEAAGIRKVWRWDQKAKEWTT